MGISISLSQAALFKTQNCRMYGFVFVCLFNTTTGRERFKLYADVFVHELYCSPKLISWTCMNHAISFPHIIFTKY